MAADDERESVQKSFYDRGIFKGAVAVVGLLSAVWAFSGAPKPWEAASELAANPLPLRNTEIILDASSRMGTPFGKATKLDIAAEAVDRYAAASEHIGLALRRVGGSCDKPYEPVVGFDDGHGDDVSAAAGTLRPSGSSNLDLAVLSAINDFSGEAFHRPGAENQIVIFAGGGDQCGDRTGREIRHQLEQAEINPEFHVYAIHVSKQELKSLKAMKRQLKKVAPVELDQADNVKQLYRAVQEDAAADTGPQAGRGEHPASAPQPEAKASEPQEGPAESRGSPSRDAQASAAEEEKPEEEQAEPAGEKTEEEKPEEGEKEEEKAKEEELEKEEQAATEERDLGPAEETPGEEGGGKAEGATR